MVFVVIFLSILIFIVKNILSTHAYHFFFLVHMILFAAILTDVNVFTNVCACVHNTQTCYIFVNLLEIKAESTI